MPLSGNPGPFGATAPLSSPLGSAFGSSPPPNPFCAPSAPPPILGGVPIGTALSGGETVAGDSGFAATAATVVGRVLAALVVVVVVGVGYLLFRDARHVEIAAGDMPEMQVPSLAAPVTPPPPEVPVSETPVAAPAEEPPATAPPDLGQTQVQAAPPIEIPPTELPPPTEPPPAPQPPPGAVEFTVGLERARDAHNKAVDLLASTTDTRVVLLRPADPAVVAEMEVLLDELESAIREMGGYSFPARSRSADILATVREIHALLTEELEVRTDPAWPTLQLLARYIEATNRHSDKVQALTGELIPAWFAWVESPTYG